jgi:methylation protein EvaC
MSYTINTHCRYCTNQLIKVIHLGNAFPLAGGFMRSKDEFEKEETYPLSLGICNNCHLLQCLQVVNRDSLFRNGYFYYSSMIPMLKTHFERYACELKESVADPSSTTILEMGCNDGVFLRPLAANGFKVIGVDPSDTVLKCIADGFTIYNTYFDEELAKRIVKDHGQIDIFVSSNSFAHIDNMKSIMDGIKHLLKHDGLAIIEVHYSKSIIDDLQFDFIYHEHMSYYTVTSFYKIAELFGMTLEHVERTKIHGDSIRVFLRNNTSNAMSSSVRTLMNSEAHLCQLSSYTKFNERLYSWKTSVQDILSCYKDKRIYGFGSSGRTNIICRFLDLKLDEIIDDAPSKIGSYTPIYHNCITSSDILKESPPDLLIILAWPYADDIIKKVKGIYSGTILIPLPELKILV